MPSPPPRVATLVLVDGRGSIVGSLAPIAVATPWWQDLGPLLDALQARDGLRPTILRLLTAERQAPPGGAVSYLAQLDSPAPHALLRPWAGALTEHPLRQAYARVGGPQADLAWAKGVLESQGAEVAGPAAQLRSWNLASLWRLPLQPAAHGTAAWLKVVPPFFAHEGAVLALLAGQAGSAVPRLLGHDGGRMLLAEIDGDDLYDADAAQRRAMIDLLVGLQSAWLGRADELLALGLPDWRGPAMTAAIGELVARRGDALTPDVRDRLGGFVAELPARFAAIAACGIPDGLVHGDFHGGNVRGRGRSLTLLDWGDSGVGHPLLDQPAFLSRMPAASLAAARRHWTGAWQRVLAQADVARAAALLAPVASARQALVYQRFLDQIEDAEHPYHRADVVAWLERTAEQLRIGDVA